MASWTKEHHYWDSSTFIFQSGLTPLHVASFMGCMNIVIYLIQNQASPDEATVRGETPLHLAARANQTDIIRILLRNGAKVDARARVSRLQSSSSTFYCIAVLFPCLCTKKGLENFCSRPTYLSTSKPITEFEAQLANFCSVTFYQNNNTVECRFAFTIIVEFLSWRIWKE